MVYLLWIVSPLHFEGTKRGVGSVYLPPNFQSTQLAMFTTALLFLFLARRPPLLSSLNTCIYPLSKLSLPNHCREQSPVVVPRDGRQNHYSHQPRPPMTTAVFRTHEKDFYLLEGRTIQWSIHMYQQRPWFSSMESTALPTG